MDLSIIFILLTGLGLGLGHSLDPDHVVAVSTLVCNNKSFRKSITSATVWGIGHSAVLLVIGLLVLTLSVVIPQSVLKLFDCAAGVLLIILGVMVVRPLIAEKISPHQGTAYGHNHSHTHPHSHTQEHDNEHEHSHSHLHKSAFTGALQGLGGSAALMLVTVSIVNSSHDRYRFYFPIWGGCNLRHGGRCLLSRVGYCLHSIKFGESAQIN